MTKNNKPLVYSQLVLLYPFIDVLHSNRLPNYVQRLLEQAYNDNAPSNAGGYDKQDKCWVTVDEYQRWNWGKLPGDKQLYIRGLYKKAIERINVIALGRINTLSGSGAYNAVQYNALSLAYPLITLIYGDSTKCWYSGRAEQLLVRAITDKAPATAVGFCDASGGWLTIDDCDQGNIDKQYAAAVQLVHNLILGDL